MTVERKKQIPPAYVYGVCSKPPEQIKRELAIGRSVYISYSYSETNTNQRWYRTPQEAIDGYHRYQYGTASVSEEVAKSTAAYCCIVKLGTSPGFAGPWSFQPEKITRRHNLELSSPSDVHFETKVNLEAVTRMMELEDAGNAKIALRRSIEESLRADTEDLSEEERDKVCRCIIRGIEDAILESNSSLLTVEKALERCSEYLGLPLETLYKEGIVYPLPLDTMINYE